jgi:hypothetical protein
MSPQSSLALNADSPRAQRFALVHGRPVTFFRVVLAVVLGVVKVTT